MVWAALPSSAWKPILVTARCRSWSPCRTPKEGFAPRHRSSFVFPMGVGRSLPKSNSLFIRGTVMKVLFRLATGVLLLPLAWASALGQNADANAKALVAQAEAAASAKDFEQAILLSRKAVALAPANDLF